MKRLVSLIATIAAVSIFTVSMTFAAPATQPADQAQAQVAPATQPADAAMPQGHPDIPEGHAEMPAGPAGMPGHAPGTSALGSIAVKVTQGTQDGPAISGGRAVIRLYEQGRLIHTMHTELDATGMAILEGIPLGSVIQPVVAYEYAGATYESIGQPMGPSDPDRLIKLKVYETTDVEPQWRIAMRHVMAKRMDKHLHITEVWAINNPDDRSYVGVVDKSHESHDHAKVEDAHNQGRTTLTLPLPAGAMHVQPGSGFSACCVRVEGGRIINTMPLLPGATEFRVDYLLPNEDGSFNLALTTPAATDHLMIFLPDDGSQVTAQGLETGDPFKAGEQQFRMYSAKQLEAGAAMSLVIEVGQAVMESITGAAGPTSQADTIKMIAGGGAGLLVLAGTFVLLKPAKRTRPDGAAA